MMHSDTYFSGAGRGEHSKAEGILYTSSPTWGKPLSDSDSGDSLFLTQHEAQPVRTVRRQRPEESSLNRFAVGELHCENEEPSSPHRPWEVSLQPRRSRKFNQPRRRRHTQKCLTRRKSLTCELAALGGFFKCVMKMTAKVKLPKRPKKQCCQEDTRGCMSPLSDTDEGGDNEDRDIKIVDLQDFIPNYKMARYGYNPWLVGNDALGTVTEENKDAPKTTPDISNSCSVSSGSDREADRWQNECSESESEFQPVQRPSTERLSSCVTDALERCFRQDEMQQKASRGSNPGSNMSTRVEKLRMRKDTIKNQCAARERHPHAVRKDEKSGTWEVEKANLDLQGCVHEDRVTALDLVHVDTEDIAPSVVEGQPPGLRRGKKQSKRKATADVEEEPIDLSPDCVPQEEGAGTAGCAAEPDPDGQPARDCLHQTRDKEYYSCVDERKSSLLNFSLAEPVGDFASSDAICEEGIRKKKWQKTKNNNGNVEEHINEPLSETLSHRLYLTQNKEKSSRVGIGGHSLLKSNILETVEDSVSWDDICEEGIRKKKKKRRKDNNEKLEEHVNVLPSETVSYVTQDKEKSSGALVDECSLLFSGVPEAVGESASGDVCEEGIRKKKKKKRKEDNNGHVEDHVNEPLSETLSNHLHLTRDKEKSSRVDVGVCSTLICSALEPVGESASGDVCEEGIRKKKKKKRKEDNNGHVEDHVNEPLSETLSNHLHLTRDKEKSSRVDVGVCSTLICSALEPVGESASGDVTYEEGIRKRKKTNENKEKDDCGNVGEHVNELPSEAFSDSLYQTQDEGKSSRVDIGWHSLLKSNILETKDDSACGDAICEEGIRKKKKNKRKGNSGNVEEHVNEPPSETFSDRFHVTQDKERTFGAVVDECSLLIASVPESEGGSASGDVTCEEEIKKKKKKRKKDNNGNVEEQVNEPPSETLSGSLHLTQDKVKSSGAIVDVCSILISSVFETVGDSASGDFVYEEGIRKKKKKRKKDNNGNVEEHVKPPSEALSNSLLLTQNIEKSSGIGGGEHSRLISSVPEPVVDSALGDTICDEGIMKKKKKKKRKTDNNGDVEDPSRMQKEWQPKTEDKDSSSRTEGQCSHSNSDSPKRVLDSASSDVLCEEVITRKKKKRKRNNCENYLVYPQIIVPDEEKSSRAGETMSSIAL